MKYPLQRPRLRADFNGLFGDILCLSHGEARTDENGATVAFAPGMIVTVFDADEDDAGRPDNLIATGAVERSPPSIGCYGSVWCLRLDENGVRHESDIANEPNQS